MYLYNIVFWMQFLCKLLLFIIIIDLFQLCWVTDKIWFVADWHKKCCYCVCKYIYLYLVFLNILIYFNYSSLIIIKLEENSNPISLKNAGFSSFEHFSQNFEGGGGRVCFCFKIWYFLFTRLYKQLKKIRLFQFYVLVWKRICVELRKLLCP